MWATSGHSQTVVTSILNVFLAFFMSIFGIWAVDYVHEWWDVLESDFTIDSLCEASDNAVYMEAWFYFLNLIFCVLYIGQVVVQNATVTAMGRVHRAVRFRIVIALIHGIVTLVFTCYIIKWRARSGYSTCLNSQNWVHQMY